MADSTEETGGLVAALSVRIEAGPGGPETDSWLVDVEVGAGVGVRDVDALARALVGTLVGNVAQVAAALGRLSAPTIHHSAPARRHAAGVPEVRTAGPGRPTVLPLRMARSDRDKAS